MSCVLQAWAARSGDSTADMRDDGCRHARIRIKAARCTQKKKKWLAAAKLPQCSGEFNPSSQHDGGPASATTDYSVTVVAWVMKVLWYLKSH